MSLTARCHSLRPDKITGWLAYFELPPEGARVGHFLVIGPAASRSPKDIQAALRAGQAAVRYLKEVPAHAPPITLLEATARILHHESLAGGTELEFGCAVLEDDQLWCLTQGRVRLVALHEGGGALREAPVPVAMPVRADQRFFLGRLPQTAEDTQMARAYMAGLEKNAGGDGGLVLQIQEGRALRAVGPATVPHPAPPVEEGKRPEFESVLEELQQSFSFPMEEQEAKPPSAAPVVETPKKEPVPSEPMAFEKEEDVPAPEPFPPQETQAEPDTPEAEPVEPAEEAPPPPWKQDDHEDEEADPARVTPLPATESTAADQNRLESPLHYAPEETRGLWFWLGVVGAILALGAFVTYLALVRPNLRTWFPTGSVTENAPMPTDTRPVTVTQELVWEESFSDPITSSPALAGAAVVFGCRDGRVYALDRADGHRIWAYAAESGFGSSPAVAGGLVVIGGYDGNIYGLDVASGEERWSVSTGGKIVASPMIDGGTAFVGSYDKHLYAVSLADGTLRWKRNLGAVLWASPAIGDDLVLVPGLDGNLTALNKENGRVRWQVSSLGPLYSSPTVGEGKVFVGSKDGHLHAFELTGGRSLWKAPAGGEVNGAVAYRQGRVVVGTEEGTILGVDAALGETVWRVATGGEVKSRPAFWEQMVWITGYDGYLHGIEWLTGEATHRFQTDSSAFSSPLIVDGIAYFGAMDGRFFAIRVAAAP